MKKEMLIWFFVLFSIFAFAQDCSELQNEVLSGEVYDFQLEDCTGNVAIKTIDGNTLIHGITLIDALASVNLKPTGSQRISIRPDDPLDFINIVATNSALSLEEFLRRPKELRSNGGNKEAEEKRLGHVFNVFPNPVQTIAIIETTATITYYKVLNENGLTLKEGYMPASSQLNLSTLNPGLHYLLVQTEDDILVTRFYKN